MIVYGYLKQYQYDSREGARAQVRIPSIHGPYQQSDAKGKLLKNYVQDEDLPWYTSLIFSNNPVDGEVVALGSIGSESNADFLVLGSTGSAYGSSTIMS